MDNNNDGSNLLGRRQAIQMLGVGITAAGGLLTVTGCKKEEAPAMAADPKPAPAMAAAPKPPPAAPAEPKPAAPAEPVAAAPANAAGLNCKDKAPIDEAATALRRALQYQEKTTTPEKKCSGCAQFVAGQYGDCGGCKLFAGAVNPEGVCLSYAPMAAAKPN